VQKPAKALIWRGKNRIVPALPQRVFTIRATLLQTCPRLMLPMGRIGQ
jgi:hypothetical protein